MWYLNKAALASAAHGGYWGSTSLVTAAANSSDSSSREPLGSVSSSAGFSSDPDVLASPYVRAVGAGVPRKPKPSQTGATFLIPFVHQRSSLSAVTLRHVAETSHRPVKALDISALRVSPCGRVVTHGRRAPPQSRGCWQAEPVRTRTSSRASRQKRW